MAKHKRRPKQITPPADQRKVQSEMLLAQRLYVSPRTQSGTFITPDIALSYSVVWACIRAITEPIASMPWHVYAKTDTGKEKLDNDLDYLLNIQPNPETIPFDWRVSILTSALLWGNGYAEIERDQAGRVVNLWILHPERMRQWRDDRGQIQYEYWPIGLSGKVNFTPNDIFHVRNLSIDSVHGLSTIQYAANAVGLALAMESFAETYFGNGALPSGVIQNPNVKMDMDAIKNILADFNTLYGGPRNSNKVAYLDGGMQFKEMGFDAEKSQMSQARNAQALEVARWFKVPPHKLQMLDRATHANVEQLQLEFLAETLLPWIISLEQEARVKLIGRNQRSRLYTKIHTESLLRSDQQARYESYAKAIQFGFLSINEVREREDLNPVPDGDTHFMQVNLQSIEMANAAPAPEPKPAQLTDQQWLQDEAARLAAPNQFTQYLSVQLPSQEVKWEPLALGASAPPPAIHVHVTSPDISLPPAPPVTVQIAPPEVTTHNHVTAAPPTVQVNVEPALPPQVTVLPEIANYVSAAQPPNVSITVEPAAPQVTVTPAITNQVTAPAPVINVAVETPAAPTVAVTNQIEIPVPEVNVSVEPQDSHITFVAPDVTNQITVPSPEVVVTVPPAPAPDVFVQVGDIKQEDDDNAATQTE